MPFRPHIRPLVPIFNPDKRTGAIVVGGTPSGTLGPTCPVSSSVEWPTSGFVNDIAISGNYAYVLLSAANSLVSVDISDPTNMTIADTLSIVGEHNNPKKIAISGTTAVVVGNGVSTYDISDPASLALLDYLFLASTVNGVAISGNYAFVCLASDFVSSIDITDTSNIAYETDVSTSINDPHGIAISGNYAFVANTANDSITSIDITDPTAMAYEDDLVLATDLNEAWALAISGNYAYVTAATATNGWVTAIDISNPAALAYNDSLTETIFQTTFGLVLAGTDIYVVSYASDTISKIDNSTEGSPLLDATLTDATEFNQVQAIDKSGSYLFVGGGAAAGTAYLRAVHVDCVV